MKVVRSRPEANYTQITNKILRDQRLTHMARGVLCEMLSNEDGWETTADRMWQQARRARPGERRGEGQRAYRACFAELERFGYLERRRLRTKTGQFETVLILHDEPADVPLTDVAVTQHRRDQGKRDVSAGGNRRCGNATLVTATSLRTPSEEHHQEHSGPSDLVGPPTSARSTSRTGDDTSILTSMRLAIADVWGEQEWTNYSNDADGLLALWEGLSHGARVKNRTAYLTEIFQRTAGAGHYLDALFGRYVEEAQHARTA